MQIAIVHYHLNRGGVTQVIVNHLRALAATATEVPVRVAVLYGGRRADWPEATIGQLRGVDVALYAIPQLDYDPDARVAPNELASALATTLAEHGFTADGTLIHVHNHALGKNVALPTALGQLADNGWPLLLQIHDFMEDYRPENYFQTRQHLGAGARQFAACLYPQGPAIHYAVLNGRDRSILAAVGFAADHLHWLPNPVAELTGLPSRQEARERLHRLFGVRPNMPYCVYPVRAIRRKNMGELLLWAAVAHPETRLAITLPPINPRERARYDRWCRLARTLQLPLLPATGGANGLAFAENIAAADRLVTTSIAEGFGMVFLEAWLFGRPLAGRDLPEITADFRRFGIQFPDLYAELAVPMQWLDRAALEAAYGNLLSSTFRAFGRPAPTAAAVEAAVDQLTRDGHIDFARLPVDMQASVVTRVKRDTNARTVLLRRNAQLQWLSELSSPPRSADLIAINRELTRREYGLTAAGQRLRRLYQKVLDSPRQGQYGLPNSDALLAAFLAVERLFPARIER